MQPIAFETIPLLAGIRARFVPNGNGLTIHLLEAGFEGQDRPCVLLLHDFLELAYSWRKVMLSLAVLSQIFIGVDLRYALLLVTLVKERESNDGDAHQGGPFSAGNPSAVCALVSSVSLELSACRSTHGSTWSASRPCHHPALGGQVESPAGRGIPSSQAAGMDQLAYGRALHSGQRRVAVSVSCRRQRRGAHGLLAHGTSRQRGGMMVAEEGEPSARGPRAEHY